jgi:hypothetical protein
MSSRDTGPVRTAQARGGVGREDSSRLLPPRLVLLALVGCLLFGYPFLAVFSRPLRLGGIPLLYVYLFVAWGAFIVAIARLVDAGERDSKVARPRPPAEP